MYSDLLNWRPWLYSLCLASTALAADNDLPVRCNAPTSSSPQTTPSETDADCVEFGAAVSELGLNWRNQLPEQVRWVTRKDAPELCRQNETTYGKRVGQILSDGCVFLTPKACTIVTVAATTPANLGNAVRECTP